MMECKNMDNQVLKFTLGSHNTVPYIRTYIKDSLVNAP